MFRILILSVVAASFGCSQHNPAVCCNTPTQCTSFGLDGIIGCDPGKVCDPTGACISPQCASSAECGDPNPYCSSAGLCSMTCAADTECPGGGQGTTQVHCVGGACVECGQASDCPATAPICTNATCHACAVNADCPSEACAADGTCVATGDIAYTTSGGSDTADCSQATPCSLAHGLSIGRTYTVLASGTYQGDQTLTIAGTRWIVGAGTQPSVTRSTPGPIITIGPASDVHFSNLKLFGATSTTTTSGDGVAVECPNASNLGSLSFTDVLVISNGANGVDANTCAVTAARSSFTNNIGAGVLVRGAATIDRCDLSENAGNGLEFDGTLALVTNSFFTRNGQNGILLSTDTPGGHIQFSTFAENLKAGLEVGQAPATTTFDVSNNLIAKNSTGGLSCPNSNCPSAGTIVLGADASSAHFTSDFDFHINTGSVAIDAASGSTMDHDFDGDVRPLGNGRDVGADEAQ